MAHWNEPALFLYNEPMESAHCIGQRAVKIRSITHANSILSAQHH